MDSHADGVWMRRREFLRLALAAGAAGLVWENAAAADEPVSLGKLDGFYRGTQLQSDDWLYFNHLRLLELAVSNGINLRHGGMGLRSMQVFATMTETSSSHLRRIALCMSTQTACSSIGT